MRSAIVAGEKVAAAAGHPVAAVPLPKTLGGKTEGGTSALTFVLPLATVLVAMVALGLVARVRARREEER